MNKEVEESYVLDASNREVGGAAVVGTTAHRMQALQAGAVAHLPLAPGRCRPIGHAARHNVDRSHLTQAAPRPAITANTLNDLDRRAGQQQHIQLPPQESINNKTTRLMEEEEGEGKARGRGGAGSKRRVTFQWISQYTINDWSLSAACFWPRASHRRRKQVRCTRRWPPHASTAPA